MKKKYVDNKESKLNLNAIEYAVIHCDSDKTYDGLEVQKMLCDAYIAGNSDNDKDEEIRKAIINVFATHKDHEMFFGVSAKDILAWLGRHGEPETLCDKCRKEQPSHSCQDITALGRCAVEHEQKPSDKIKSKFHEGDWIVFNGLTLLIEEVVQGYYRTVSIDDIHNSYDWDINNAARLWTIKDAKDGDILTCYSYKKGKPIVQTGMFRQYIGKYKGCPNCFLAHIGIDWDGNLKTNMYMGSTDIFPATKKQRDYLFETSKAGFKA